MDLTAFRKQLNKWGLERVPFLFIVDFELEKPVIIRLDEIRPHKIMYNVNGFSNDEDLNVTEVPAIFPQPHSFHEYKEKFDFVFQHLILGDSYLTNLTVSTPVEVKGSLRDLYTKSVARYKLFYNDEFLVFSPESFIKINANKIFSFPMKGTIDASIPQARETILNNQKEMAEHVTIVDLIRNDLSMIARNVRVNRFRYVDEVVTSTKRLLQVSSEITGDLNSNWNASLGDILISLLPAGSVSGAPKPKTLSIIRQSEKESRGYYSGVFGYFDGQQVDSGVMIRYIEKKNNRYFYRSGGGITTQSHAEQEYQETIDKVYVPIA